jgi:hypothetical protein
MINAKSIAEPAGAATGNVTDVPLRKLLSQDVLREKAIPLVLS